jgi:nucleotidyltransferase substrate binding protein (TIGR01987 family)
VDVALQVLDLDVLLQPGDQELRQLGEALEVGSDNPLAIDGTTQRFEFSFELMWKALRRALQQVHGFEVVSPKQTLQKAYAVGWINDEPLWVEMLQSRNLTSHTYKEDLAREIYGRIHRYYPALRQLYDFLKATLDAL